MRNGFKRGLAAALCAALSVGALAGCSKKEKTLDTTKALLSLKDGASVSAGAADFYLRYQQAEFESGIGNFIRSYYGGLWDVDLTGTGEAYGNAFKQDILEDLQHMVFASTHAEEFDAALTDDENKAIADAADAFIAANSEEALTQMGATKEAIVELLSLYTIREKVEDGMIVDVDTEVSDEEAAQRTVSYVAFVAETEAETEEETEELEETSEGYEAMTESAEAVLEAETEVKTGAGETEPEEALTESGEAVAVEAESEAELEDPAMAVARMMAQMKAEFFLKDAKEADDFAAIAQETAAADEHANYSSFTFGDDDTYPDAAIIEATKGLADGEVVDHVVNVGNIFYVLHVDTAFDEAATENKKAEIVRQREQEAVNAAYEAWNADAEFTLDTDVWVSWTFDRAFEAPEAETELVEDVLEAESEGAEGVAEIATEAATE